jgi:hypothetical protein
VKSRHWVLYAVALVGFLSALAVLLFLRETVREAVVVPVLYLAWLGNLVFRSIHQAIFWAAFFLLALILLATSLWRRAGREQLVARAPGRRQKSGRVATWAALVARTADESRTDLFALRAFRRLITTVWAYQENVSPSEIEADVRSGALTPPAEWQFYFQSGARPEAMRSSVLRRTLRRLVSMFRARESRAGLSPESRLRSLIESLEAEQEDARDR